MPPGKIVEVLAAVVRRGDKYLVCRRPLHKRHGGLWEFPGGKIRNGESHADAIRRELREEILVEANSIGDPVFRTKDPNSDFLIVFVPVEIVGQPRLVEHIDLQWCNAEDLQNEKLAPSDARFVREYLIGA